MAQAKRISEKKEWTPAVELRLSEEEAQVLRDIFYIGVTGTGRRDLIDNISSALSGAGIYGRDDVNDITGRINFTRED